MRILDYEKYIINTLRSSTYIHGITYCLDWFNTLDKMIMSEEKTSVFIVCENDNYGENLYLATKDTLKEAEELKGNDTTRNIYEHEISLDNVFDSKIKALEYKCNVEGFEDYKEMRKAEDELRCLKVAKRLLNDK